ncbi:alpha/beta hydrolase [Gammaproteobacteria bacterium AS21]
MSVNEEQLRSVLPQSNDGKVLAKCWHSYYQYYQYQDIVNSYNVHIDSVACAAQQIVFQLFSQRHRSSKGTFIIVHGYMDHSGLYHHIVRHLLGQGFNVLIFDKQGHGVSSGERYGINDFSEYAHQLDVLIKHTSAQILDTPFYLIGQSTGAAVVMEYLLNSVFTIDKRVKQVMLLAPLVRNHRFLMTRVHHYLTRLFIKNIKRSKSHSSHDPLFLDLINNRDPLGHKYMKASWIGALMAWEQRFEQYKACAMDVRVIQGSDDTTVAWQYNLAAIQQKFTVSEQVVITGAKHNLVNETEHYREQLYRAMKL